VLLEPDVAAAFPDSAAVNDALRTLLTLAARTRRIKQRQGRLANLRKRPDVFVGNVEDIIGMDWSKVRSSKARTTK